MDTPVIIAIVVAVVIIAIIIAVVMSRSNDKETPRKRPGAARRPSDGDGPRTSGTPSDGRERTRDVARGRQDDGPRRPRNRDGRGDRDGRDDNRR
jgi:hypothetical protein